MKVNSQQRERLAAVALDVVAMRLLEVLDKETSIRWEDLPKKTDSDWSEAARAITILSSANLCEASPTRIRLSNYGGRLLAENDKGGFETRSCENG